MALQGVAVGTAGSGSSQLAVAVDGLAPPGPQVQLRIVVLQHQHDKAAEDAVLTLLQQGLATQEVHVLERGQNGLVGVGGRGVKMGYC